MSVIATFNPPNRKPVQAVVDSVTGVIKVPKEATAGWYGVGTIVFVGLADGVQRISSDVEYIVRRHSNASGTEPAEPTPDLLQQVLTLSKDAQTAAKNAEDVANSVREDADNGKFIGPVGPQGPAGKDGVQIDDAAVSEDKPWSSKHIIDMLCPPLEESGNPVVCYPVAGYPLGVKASWEPVQEGSGTPSPENIRSIKGRDSVTVERCGENLLNFPQIKTWTQYDGPYTLKLKAATYYLTCGNVVRGGTNAPVIAFTDENLITWKYLNQGMKEKIQLEKDCQTFALYSHGYDFHGSAGVTATVEDLMLVAGNEISGAYKPYTGQTTPLTLHETVYGGEVDAVSGEGQETQKLVILNGTESWNSWGINAHNPAITGFYTYDINDYDAKNAKGICSHLETPNQDVWGGRNAGIGFATVGSSRYFMFSMLTSSLPDISAGHEVASLKAYLAAQNDAGTPVQIAYKLAEPVPFTATGAQPLSALAGANTVLTDADSATVTGRADPVKRITDLEDAVASQT